jgi:hypothetical protein
MQTQKAILAILLIFGAGVVAGFFIGRVKSPAQVGVTPRLKVGESAQIFRLSVDELDQRLDLTTDQEDKIRGIYVESRRRLKFLLTPAVRESVREEVHKLDQAIRAELTEEQIAKFSQLPGMRRPTGKPPEPPIPPTTKGTNDPMPVPEGNTTLLPLPKGD